MNKVIIFLIVFGAASIAGYGMLMPEIPNFFLQEVLIIEGTDQIGVVVDGEFTCDCVDMAGNLNDCVFADFCALCDPNPAPPGGSGLQCDVAPNEEGPYFNSAAICNVVTTCP